MTSEHRVGARSELEPGSVRGAGPWVVLNVDGERVAFSRRCRHLRADLAEGHIDEAGCLVCPWHRARYDLRDGRMVSGPQGVFARIPGLGLFFTTLTRVLPLRRAEVIERDGDVIVRGRATELLRIRSIVQPMNSLALDPQQALALIRRKMARAPVQLAEGLARLVRDTPPDRLDQLMRTPARRVVLDGIFWQMPQHLDRRRAAGMRSSIRWQITGRADGEADTYQLKFEDGRCRVIRGSGGADAPVTITVDGTEFLRIATGNSDPMRAYFNGRVALAGDIVVAAKLVSLFRIPGGIRP